MKVQSPQSKNYNREKSQTIYGGYVVLSPYIHIIYMVVLEIHKAWSHAPIERAMPVQTIYIAL